MKNEIRITPSLLCLREAVPVEGQESKAHTIGGYAIRFNEESLVLDDLGEKFTEVIAPSCVTEEYLRECDVKMTLFHNREKLLARSNRGQGSLRLAVDAEGVSFEFDVPDTELGRFAEEGVRRGDLNGCSFTFAPQDYDVMEKEDGGLLIRHTKFAWLGEMTIGSDPAYPTTSVNCRELHERMEKGEEPEDEIETEEQKEPTDEEQPQDDETKSVEEEPQAEDTTAEDEEAKKEEELRAMKVRLYEAETESQE